MARTIKKKFVPSSNNGQTFTFVIPANVRFLYLRGVGGGSGGGGGAGGGTNTHNLQLGGAGGAAAPVFEDTIDLLLLGVAAGTVCEVVCGAGGAGGAAEVAGSVGGDTIFRVQSGATLATFHAAKTAGFAGTTYFSNDGVACSIFVPGGAPVGGYRSFVNVALIAPPSILNACFGPGYGGDSVMAVNSDGTYNGYSFTGRSGGGSSNGYADGGAGGANGTGTGSRPPGGGGGGGGGGFWGVGGDGGAGGNSSNSIAGGNGSDGTSPTAGSGAGGGGGGGGGGGSTGSSTGGLGAKGGSGRMEMEFTI